MAESNGHATAEELKTKYLGGSEGPKVKVVKVPDVPEWGDTYVRAPTALEADEFDGWIQKNGGEPGARAFLLSRCLCTHDGERLGFTTTEMFTLGENSSHITEPIVDVCLELKAGTYKETAGNSTAAPAAASG